MLLKKLCPSEQANFSLDKDVRENSKILLNVRVF